MKIENLKIFIEVARIGNINKAADALYLTHQNLSFIIRNMEKELGMTLFIRNTKGIQLTEDGIDFLHVVQPMVASYENFLKSKAEKNMQSIVLNIYTTPTLATYISELQEVNVSDYFLSMHKRNVNELIDLLESNHQGIYIVPVYNGYPQIAKNQRDKIVLLQDKSVVIAHKNSEIARRKSISRQEWNEVPLITSSYYLQEVKNRVVVNVDNLSTCKKLMRERPFCYSATRWVYETFFVADGEWLIVDEMNGEIEYTLLLNLPVYLKEIALKNFMPVVSEIFNVNCNNKLNIDK